MATNRWLGTALAAAQVNTLVVGGTAALGQRYSVTINGKTVSYTALNTDTNTTIATALQLLLAAATYPEFAEVTWANPSAATITGTSATAGRVFTSTSAATGTGTLVTTAGIATPVISSTSTASTGGSLAQNTTYTYRLSALNAAGETLASAEVAQVVGASGTATNTVTLNWSAPAGTGITGFRVYGRTAAAEQLIATVGATAVSYVDTGLTPAGALPLANTTVSSGPNDLSCPANWSTGAVPVAGDDVFFQNSAISALYNLQILAAVQPNSVHVDASFTGKIGLAFNNAAGYAEYRQRYLQIGGCGAGNVIIGQGSGTGSGKVQIDVGANAATNVVLGSGTSSEAAAGVPAIVLKGGAATSALYATKGTIGVALFAGETARIDTLDIGYQTNLAGDVTCSCGSGVTLATINQTGGTLTTNSGSTTATLQGGTTTFQAGNITTLNIQKTGSCFYTGTGTIAAANVSGGGSLDFSHDMRGRTVTTLKMYSGAKVRDPFKTLNAGAMVFNLEQCSLADVTLDTGVNLSLTVGAAA